MVRDIEMTQHQCRHRAVDEIAVSQLVAKRADYTCSVHNATLVSFPAAESHYASSMRSNKRCSSCDAVYMTRVYRIGYKRLSPCPPELQLCRRMWQQTQGQTGRCPTARAALLAPWPCNEHAIHYHCHRAQPVVAEPEALCFAAAAAVAIAVTIAIAAAFS
eukprot:1448-Heterococcus_DN1.PRE.1